jgi:hypothetical protein
LLEEVSFTAPLLERTIASFKALNNAYLIIKMVQFYSKSHKRGFLEIVNFLLLKVFTSWPAMVLHFCWKQKFSKVQVTFELTPTFMGKLFYSLFPFDCFKFFMC